MDKAQILEFLGWVCLINVTFFFVGLLKITVFKRGVEKQLVWHFKERAPEIMLEIPKILFFYWILIICFLLSPYLALRLFM